MYILGTNEYLNLNEFERYCLEHGDILIVNCAEPGRLPIWKCQTAINDDFKEAVHRIRAKKCV